MPGGGSSPSPLVPVRRLTRHARRAAEHLTRTVAEPTPRPPEWRTGPPDFVGVGAQRAGTTWWYALVTDHPAVRGPAAVRRRLRARERPAPGRSVRTAREGMLQKELHFFEAFPGGGLTAEDTALYHRFFPRPPGAVAGEWTPRYMCDFWTPPLLRSAAPEAKLLVMLRDPVERFRSGLAREASVAMERGARLPLSAWSDAVDRGRYASQLRRLLEHFGRDRLLVLQYERCLAEPRAELRRTYEFLGVEPTGHAPPYLEARRGYSSPKAALPEALRRELEALLRDEMRGTADLFPEVDLARWPAYRDSG